MDETTQFSLDLMIIEHLDHLLVVSAEGRKLVGVVSKRGLEQGCWGLGHDLDRCLNGNHVERDISPHHRHHREGKGEAGGEEEDGVVVALPKPFRSPPE